MKVKMKLDVQSIKNFALTHGEKLAFGVVGIVFAMFVYSALRREVLDANHQPEKLQEKANQVQTHVQQSTFDEKESGLAVAVYSGRAKRQEVTIPPEAVPHTLNPPVIEQKTKRDDPKVFAIEELRADSGFGVFALAGNEDAKAGGAAAGRQPAAETRRAPQRRVAEGDGGFTPSASSRLIGRGYAIITGLVPTRKQTQEYSRVFNGSLGEDPKRDTPLYRGYVLQRAEIDPAQPDKLDEGDWKNVTPAKDLVWERTMPDVVAAALEVPELTAELPPLVGDKWGESAKHPKVGAPVAPPAAPAPPAAEKRDARFEDEPEPATPVAAPAEIEYRLCRFFDFNVEPMKRYRYRVRVDLNNPNFGLPGAILVHPETKQGETIATEWSNPTGTVAIPDRYGVLAGGVAENSRSYDPRVTIVATAIDPKEGIEAATKIPVQRASVVNTIAENVEAIDPRDRTIRVLNSVNFQTNIVVVDIYGGRPLSKRTMSAVTGPVEVLVMDPQGNLRVRNELDDHALVEARLPEEEESSKEKSDDNEEDPLPTAERMKRSRASAAGK